MPMSKRKFLVLSSITLGAQNLGLPYAQAGSRQEVILDGVSFRWWHQAGQLIGTLAAPTDGWIAVGFSIGPGIKDTHFIMAAVSEEPPRFEEHFPVDLNHRRISELGWPETARMRSGQFQHGTSTVTFDIPSRPLAGSGISLAQGSNVYLMLAWSQDTDFNHHSAWRRHLAISL